jgi:hypothetical protein
MHIYKMKQTVLIVVLFFLANTVSSQTKSYTFEGFFQGENMSVQCRESVITPFAFCECFDSIAVNGVVIDDLLYEGYQLDIANKVDLKIYEKFAVTFYYEECDFRIPNVHSFLPKEILPVEDFKHEKGILSWTTPQVYPQLKMWVQIEQYKWGRWVKIGDNQNIVDERNYSMDINDYLFNGENKFRAVVATINRIRIYSDEIVVSHKGKKVKCKVDQKKEQITFSKATHYELYNSTWMIAKRGFGKSIDIKGLKADDYTIKFANQELIFTIK